VASGDWPQQSCRPYQRSLWQVVTGISRAAENIAVFKYGGVIFVICSVNLTIKCFTAFSDKNIDHFQMLSWDNKRIYKVPNYLSKVGCIFQMRGGNLEKIFS